MSAHLKRNKFGYYCLVDGYRNYSLKTKMKREAEARLRQYREGKFGLTPVPTVQKFYDEWIEKKFRRLSATRKSETTSRRSEPTSSRDSKVHACRTSGPKSCPASNRSCSKKGWR